MPQQGIWDLLGYPKEWCKARVLLSRIRRDLSHWWGSGKVNIRILIMVRSGPVEIIVRGQSYGWRLPKYCPPIPLTTRRVCTPCLCCVGRTHLPGGEGGGGSIFWKTSDTALYSTYVSTLRVQISLKDSYLRNHTHWGRPLYADDDDFVVFIRHLLHVCLSRASKKVCCPRNLQAEFQQNCCKGKKRHQIFIYRWIKWVSLTNSLQMVWFSQLPNILEKILNICSAL